MFHHDPAHPEIYFFVIVGVLAVIASIVLGRYGFTDPETRRREKSTPPDAKK